MSEYLHLPRLSSWASSSCCSFSRDDWETTVQAGNTCRPSHTNKTAVSSLSAASDRPTANGRRSRRISLCSVPVCPSAVSLLLDLSLLGLPPAVWPGALQPSPPWTWMSYLEWALFCYLYFPLSPFLMPAIFIPLSSGSKHRSSSGPISISRGPQQQNGKANTEIQSLGWTPSS